MKKTFTILSLITGIALNAIAQIPGQPIKGVIVKGGKNPGGNALISLSGGITNPSSPTKQNANIANGYAFNANVYIPLFAKGGNDNLAGKTDHFFSVGPNAGGEYFGSNKDYETSGFTPYNITGQSSNPGFATRGSGSPKVQGFKAELGLQSNFSFGQFTVSPILNAAYLNVKQQAFAIAQSNSVNGQNRDFNLYTQAETKTSGFAFIPKLRLAYFPGKLGFFVEGNYIIGPSIKNETTTFKPQGVADAKGFYSIDQMLTGSNVATVTTTKYNSLGFNFGISLALGKSINEKGIKREATIPQTKNITEKAIKSPPNRNETVRNHDKNCNEYTAPEILMPSDAAHVQIDNGRLVIRYKKSNALFLNYKIFVWRENEGRKELIHEKLYPNNFNGSIEELKLAKGKTENLTIRMQAVAAENTDYPNIKGDRAAYQKANCTTFQHNGFSNTINISSNSSACSPEYSFNITKAECIEKGKIKVTGNYTVTLPTATTGILNLNTFTAEVNGNPVAISNATSNISPVPTGNIPSGSVQNFSFEIDGDAVCDQQLNIYYTVGSTIQCGPGTTPISNNILCVASYLKLPCCICNYCDKPENMSIKDISHSTAIAAGNNLNILQQISVGPKNISEITAALVSIKEFEVDEACKECRKKADGTLNENEVYHFINSNTAQWTAGSPIPASSGNSSNSFPTKILEWKTNSKGVIDFNLTLALPGTSSLSCCERHGQICIRYSFTDIECKTCNILVCYTY